MRERRNTEEGGEMREGGREQEVDEVKHATTMPMTGITRRKGRSVGGRIDEGGEERVKRKAAGRAWSTTRGRHRRGGGGDRPPSLFPPPPPLPSSSCSLPLSLFLRNLFSLFPHLYTPLAPSLLPPDPALPSTSSHVPSIGSPSSPILLPSFFLLRQCQKGRCGS